MIRFIVNLIFFSLLFYAIWLFFPDTFAVIVSWIAKLFEFIRELSIKAYDYVQGLMNKTTVPDPIPPVKSLFGW